MDFTVELTFADSSNGAGRSQFYLLVFFFFSFLNRTFAKNSDQFLTNLVKKDRTWPKDWKSGPS